MKLRVRLERYYLGSMFFFVFFGDVMANRREAMPWEKLAHGTSGIYISNYVLPQIFFFFLIQYSRAGYTYGEALPLYHLSQFYIFKDSY